MFEFLFKYPPSAFTKGQIVLLGAAPGWALGLAIAVVLAGLGWLLYRRRNAGLGARHIAVVWALQSAMLALLLLLLWQPALSVATLKPQQNVVAVVIDDSRSMAIADNGKSRRDEAAGVLDGGLIDKLKTRFQVRLYRMGDHLERIEKSAQLNAAMPASHLGESLKQVMAESATLPIGAVVLLSDGADNAGGIDLPTMQELRRQRIPIHAIGFGREKMQHDIEVRDAQVSARTLADSRLSAQVTFRQFGYAGRKARLAARDGGKVVASQEIALKPDGVEQTESLIFNAGAAGARAFQIGVDVLDGEENKDNNSVTRLVNVEGLKPRILYIEGEPKWEFKFIRRAIEEDRSLQLATILRTTQNKIYRQGINSPNELEQGFPAQVDELFAYQGIIIGGVELAYFTPTQQELIRQFVDRRGGGLLLLGGRAGLADGGWGRSALSDLLPVNLPDRKTTFIRDPATVELTPAGRDSLICRLEENPDRNVERWKKLPYLANYQDAGTPKPGAVVLADALPTSRGRLPLLVIENYGRGRTGVLATSGTWRWQMQQDVADKTHEMFWQQLLRWLVSDTQGRVISSTPQPVLSDESRVPLRVEVRDRNYLPASDVQVEARVLGPDGLAEQVTMAPEGLSEGVYTAEWTAPKAGSYVAEVLAKRGEEEIGRDVLTFRREDGVAENFRAVQNRELLEKLATDTGGRYYRPNELAKLDQEINYSEAGLTVRETRELWNMPVVLFLALGLKAAEWLLRRRWGAV